MIKNFNNFLNEKIQFDFESTGRTDWDDILKNTDDFKEEIIYIKPDDFLNRVNYKRFTIDYDKVETYFEILKNKKTKVPIPTMWFQDKFQYERDLQPSWHDGTHRVLAFKKLDVKIIPVKIIY